MNLIIINTQYPDNTVLGLFETESGAMDFIAEMIEKKKLSMVYFQNILW
jgi:hypothetical protein